MSRRFIGNGRAFPHMWREARLRVAVHFYAFLARSALVIFDRANKAGADRAARADALRVMHDR